MIEETATRLEALGNPTRLWIYLAFVLAGDSGLPVGRLQAMLDMAPSTLSHHLKLMVIVGLMRQERQATTLNCKANFEITRALVDFLVAECCVEGNCASTSCTNHGQWTFLFNFFITGRIKYKDQ